jgi:hypothetical protein
VHPRNKQVVELLSRSQLRSYPAGLFSSSRPGLRRTIGVAIFWTNFRIGSSSRSFNCEAIELSKASLKLFLFGLKFCRQNAPDLFVQARKFINGQFYEILVFQGDPPTSYLKAKYCRKVRTEQRFFRAPFWSVRRNLSSAGTSPSRPVVAACRCSIAREHAAGEPRSRRAHGRSARREMRADSRTS